MATYYISPTGNDSTGAGTSGNPYLSVNKAFTVSTAGDTIHCLAGTYGASSWNSAITFNHNVSIVGDGFATTIFDRGNTQAVWSSSATVTVSQLTFQNVNPDVFGGVFHVSSTGCAWSFTNCVFKAFDAVGRRGFFSAGATGSHSFVGCLFSASTDSNAAAATGVFYCSAGTLTATVRSCTFYSNQAAANTVALCNIEGGSGGIINASWTDTIIYNANGVNQAFVLNTTLNNSGSNNDILGYSSSPSLTGNISTDPLFVDAANGDFNLRPTSPCIDAGVIY